MLGIIIFLCPFLACYGCMYNCIQRFSALELGKSSHGTEEQLGLAHNLLTLASSIVSGELGNSEPLRYMSSCTYLAIATLSIAITQCPTEDSSREHYAIYVGGGYVPPVNNYRTMVMVITVALLRCMYV